MRGRRRVALAALLLGLACATGGVPDPEIPEDPIAFSYHTPEEARKRAEDYQDRASRGGAAGALAPVQLTGFNDLVASEENVNEILGRILGKHDEERPEHLGRLALLHPRSREVEIVEAARRGSVPLAWSPDRTRLLFAQPTNNDLQIQEYSLVDRTVRPVTAGPLAHTQACYGPEGRIVATAVDTRGDPMPSRIAISGPGGRGPFVAVTDGPADHSPTCRPEAESIVFVRETGPGSADLYVLDGLKRLRRLSPGRHPRFSPDGEWVAFAAPYKRELRIWRIRPDGSGRAPIGHGIRHEARPSVSPDGRLVAYVASEERPRRHLYLRRFDGSGDRILFAEGDGEFPVW